MKETKSYQVNYLLSISRMPDRFFAILNNLKGRDALYHNPGVSLRSYVVGNCIRRETVTLDGDMLAVARECESFSLSAETISKIVETLIKLAEQALTVITRLKPDHQRKLISTVTDLQEMAQVLKMTFESFIMTQDPAKTQVDLMTMHGINLREAMYDMQDKLDETYAYFQRITPDEPPKVTA